MDMMTLGSDVMGTENLAFLCSRGGNANHRHYDFCIHL